ncbi:MAG: DUF1624 domain-containing protein [Clostridiales bacterium]|nr:DUF1624 domain-containing protein [Clostridiales bacterium]
MKRLVSHLSRNDNAVLRPGLPRPRIHAMDELRGFCVLCMIFYHAFYTMGFLFDLPLGRTLLYFFMPAEPFFAGLFILISGISSQLSHSNLIRGIKLLAVAAAITGFTLLLIPEEAIRFGILHLLSAGMILFGLVSPLLNKCNVWAGLLLTGALFVCTFQIGTLGFGVQGIFSVPMPPLPFSLQFLYPNRMIADQLYSADYFPLLPWIFLFLAGTFLGRFARDGLFPRFLYPSRVPPLSWLGKHALILYIVHQPVIFGLVYGVMFLLRALGLWQGTLPVLF